MWPIFAPGPDSPGRVAEGHRRWRCLPCELEWDMPDHVTRAQCWACGRFGALGALRDVLVGAGWGSYQVVRWRDDGGK